MITVQSPTRFDLAGGTLDLWPIWAMLGQATTVNVAIGIHTHCSIKPLEGQQVVIESKDFDKRWDFKDLQSFLSSTDKDLSFFQAHVKYWMPSSGFHMKTMSESPVGGGLGGSSSLSISVFKAFMEWQGKTVDYPHEMVRHCSNIEAFILKTPTGSQDYYPPALGGLNIIDYGFTGPSVQTLHTHKKDMAERFAVVYTGKSHHSGINNWMVLRKFIEGDKETRSALEQIAEIATDMKSACLENRWEKIPALFEREFSARLMLAESFMSDEIAKLKKISEELGADGMKICGAGGGGCVVVWCPPEKKSDIQQGIQERGFRVIDTQLA